MNQIITQTNNSIQEREKKDEWYTIKNMYTTNIGSIKDFMYYIEFFKYYFVARNYRIPMHIKCSSIDKNKMHGCWRNPVNERVDYYTMYNYEDKGALSWEVYKECKSCEQRGKKCTAAYHIKILKEMDIELSIIGLYFNIISYINCTSTIHKVIIILKRRT